MKVCFSYFCPQIRIIIFFIDTQFFDFSQAPNRLPNPQFLFILIVLRIGRGQLGSRLTSPMSRKPNRRNVGVLQGHKYHFPTIQIIVG